MAIHKKQHAISNAENHAPGTNGTLLGTESSALAEKAFGTAATAGNIVQRDGSGDVVVPTTPSSAPAATSKSYVDGLTYLSAGDGIGKSGGTISSDVAVAALAQQYGGIVKDRNSDGTGAAAADAGFLAVKTDNVTLEIDASNQAKIKSVSGLAGTIGTPAQVSATGDTTTISPTDGLLSGMTLTPGAGGYLIWFTTTLENTSGAQSTTISIYVGGVQVAHTERPSKGQANNPYPVATHAYVTGVTGGQAIEIRWRVSGGTGTTHQRTLTVVKVN